MSEFKVTKTVEKIKVRLETVRYGGWDSLEVAIDCSDPTNVYLTFPTIETILNWEPDNCRKKSTSKSLKDFTDEGSGVGKFSATITNKTTSGNPKVTLLTLDDFRILATWEVAVNGNIEVAKLLAVGFCDSLRSIVCEQLGIVLAVEDRNEWMIERLAGKIKRTCLTDAIKAYLDTHDVSDATKTFMYSNVSDRINVGLTGHKAKYWKDLIGCSSSDLLRDRWTNKHLENIKYIEVHATRSIVYGQTPMDAIDIALEFHNFSLESSPVT